VSPERVTTDVDGREITLSNLDKVLFPDTGFTKGQLVDYYARIADVMLPHINDRPVTFRRYPDGVDGQSFFEKHAPRHAPEWLRTVTVASTASEGSGRTRSGKAPSSVEYAVVDDRASLVWSANLAAIELHVPLWHIGRRRNLPAAPDHLVFDLDPGSDTTIVECCRVARWIVDLLGTTTEPVAKTSGSKGLQVYAHIGSRVTWEKQRTQALEIAERLEREHPDAVVSNMRKELRKGRVLIDWSQNHPAKTTIAVYSVRARSAPTVSTPVTWDEVADCAKKGDPSKLVFRTEDVLKRIDKHGDLFADFAVK
jgi:bifunctional non-homologous end joining protein LigD